MNKKKALGKGIGALIPEKKEEEAGNIANIKIGAISPNRFQPRKQFNPERHKELVASIKEKGIVQPILIRPTKDGKGFEIIAGERRLRATKELGLEEIPAIIKKVSDEEALELSLIENIQREELNPIEEASAYKELIDKFNLAQEDIARAVGKDRSTISNTLRLLKLPKKIQDYVSRGTLSMGHARAILGIENEKQQIKIADEVAKKGLSVRETEGLVNRSRERKGVRQEKAKDPCIRELEEELQRILGTKVTITQGKKRGKIQLEFYTPSDFERLIKILKK